MCCLLATMSLIGPRFGILLWWLMDTDRWNAAFENFFLAFVGFLLVPWTTIAYVATFPGGITGFDWVILALGLFVDFLSYGGGGYAERYRR